MAYSLGPIEARASTERAPWRDPLSYWGSIDAATADLDAPVGVLHADAVRFNAHDLLRRAAGKPVRIASKSLRVRSVIEALLELDGFSGVLAYTLAEALWLADTIDDVVVGYPSADRGAIARLVTAPLAAARVTLMIDSIDHLDLIDAVRPPAERETVRICVELDASWRSRGPLGTVGVHRSPLHSVDDIERVARAVVERPGFVLVGIMSYEAQIAGVADTAGRRAYNASVAYMQRHSMPELVERRGLAVERVRRLADLEFVNGGGTGSLEQTTQDDSVTELAAGSGIFAGRLFDGYSRFSPAPAAAFGLTVARRPEPAVATVLGGGFVASGPPGLDRLPTPVSPAGLRFIPRESAGEVQTPLAGAAARPLRIGDRVWFRHAKSGELSERLDGFAVLDADASGILRVVDDAPTYRGEGRTFV
ncbi:alanine racemase [Labedella endophytica]|uniref:Amino acid deaminase/aldolase n=1 Tax=Labedella endophytica TaxID=1523160 RepID=A0A3S0X9C4_9MICO|nr:alanine racemase [Labedella endophytica]RUQ99185.1 amino acid deaminase/aldolase [Labedella endophytica]